MTSPERIKYARMRIIRLSAKLKELEDWPLDDTRRKAVASTKLAIHRWREIIASAIPECWPSGDRISEDDVAAITALRKAGCRCEFPLLGSLPEVGPRCRLCNTVARGNDDKA